jgi:hypothetical protein
MATSRGPFPFANRFVNPLVARLTKTPLRKLVGSGTTMITVTGRSSGKEFTFPVTVTKREGQTLTIGVMMPAKKVWWRNLTGDGAPVRIEQDGVDRTGHAVARGDETSGVTVEITLDS